MREPERGVSSSTDSHAFFHTRTSTQIFLFSPWLCWRVCKSLILHYFMKKKRLFLLCIPLIGMLASCTSFSLASEGVAYQSVRSASPVAASEIPENAQIIVSHQLNDDGLLDVVVKNNTGQIMVIDRTRSFFRNISGNSIPYYDPTVRTSTNSYTSGQERGVGVNLGSIAGALGVGGAIGQALMV